MKLKILISLLCFFCILILVELGLRLFSPVYFTGYIGTYQYDGDLGVRFKENLKYYQTTDYQQEIITNSFGSVNFEKSFKDYKHLIFAIGDSYTQGTGLPHDDSYPFQLSMMLNLIDTIYYKEYGVVNLGLAAYGLDQAIISLEIFRDKIGKPEYILYMGCTNDYYDDLLFENGSRHNHLVDGNPNWGLSLKPLQWFTNDTEIGKRIKILIGQTIKHADVSEKNQNGNKSIAELQVNRLNRLVEISRKMKCKLIVSWAHPSDNEKKSYRWLKDWANKNNVGFADWYPSVKDVKSILTELPTDNNHSGGHYRSWVNTIIARSYFQEIK